VLFKETVMAYSAKVIFKETARANSAKVLFKEVIRASFVNFLKTKLAKRKNTKMFNGDTLCKIFVKFAEQAHRKIT